MLAGEATLAQSYEAVKTEGTIAMIGFLGKSEKPISSLEPLIRVCSLRGIAVGSREQMKAMNRCMEINNIKPVVDEKIFNFKQTKDAYKHLLSQQHFGRFNPCILRTMITNHF